MKRKRIYEIIEKSEGNDRLSTAYDIFMIVIIVISLIPLAFKEDNAFLMVLDKVCVGIFIVDYILRWITADFKFAKHSVGSFLRYPFSFLAIIDLISILPSLSIIGKGFKVLRVFRMIRTLRVFRSFKAFRYSKNFEIIGNVIKNSKRSLIAVCLLAGGYILFSALVIYNVEPDSFNNFFDAIYWATVSLTTVGYGDIYPVTIFGRIITMLSSIFGIAIIALPSGIITAGFMNEISKTKQQDNCELNSREEDKQAN